MSWTLTPDQRSKAVIRTANYGQAGAIELLGDGLPPVASGHNGYWDWGPPPDERTLIVLVGDSWPSYWGRMLGRCQPGAVIDNGLGVPNDEQGSEVQVCPSMAKPWSVIWPELRHID